jgi:hypothetical protein
MKRMLVALSCGVAVFTSAAAVPAAAQTERPQTTLAGHLVVRDECVFSNLADMDARTRATPESGLFAPIIAGFAGNLLSGAVGEIASAIRRASEEHAYTLVGSDGYLSGNIIRSEASSVSTYQYVPEPKCLILHVPSDPLQRRGTGPSPYAEFAYADLGEQVDETLADPRDVDLAGIGINRVAPAVYIELALLPGPEGVMVRPMFVWYREPIASAGTRSRSTELLVELATPFHAAGGDPLGTLFGVSRIRLPRLQPGHTPLRTADLEGLGATYIPYRPSTGPLGTQIAALQTARSRPPGRASWPWRGSACPRMCAAGCAGATSSTTQLMPVIERTLSADLVAQLARRALRGRTRGSGPARRGLPRRFPSRSRRRRYRRG